MREEYRLLRTLKNKRTESEERTVQQKVRKFKQKSYITEVKTIDPTDPDKQKFPFKTLENVKIKPFEPLKINVHLDFS